MTERTMIYWDTQDPDNLGWARRTTGAADESGPIENRDAVEYLEALNDGNSPAENGKRALADELENDGVDLLSVIFIDRNNQEIGPIWYLSSEGEVV